MPQDYRHAVVAYFTISTENHEKKHLLGVFDDSEVLHPDAERNGTANYFVCDELEKRGWQKREHNHNLAKHGVEIRIRHLGLSLADGFTIDESYVDLQRPQELLDKMLSTLGNMGFKS
jgi:hypothetical protein